MQLDRDVPMRNWSYPHFQENIDFSFSYSCHRNYNMPANIFFDGERLWFLNDKFIKRQYP